MKTTLPILALLLLCLAANPGPPAAECANAKVKWLTHDQALAAGREKKLPVLIYFRRDGCRFCELLSNNGFDREEIACYIDRKFVAAIIDTNREPDLRKQYRVPGEPTVWFLEPGGKGIDYFVGYVPPERLTLILRFIGDGFYKKMSFDEFQRREGGVKP